MAFCCNGTLEFHFKDDMKFIVFQLYLDAFLRDTNAWYKYSIPKNHINDVIVTFL